MPFTYTPTTELEAVNTMLAAIGEAPVNFLDDQNMVDVAVARKTLHEISRDLQTSEWYFNTEENYPLVRDNDKEIDVPPNALRVQVPPGVYSGKPIHRGNRLYDVENHTYKFVSDLKVKILFFLSFNELPEAARRYVTIKSARTFQDRVVGSDTLHVYTSQDEQRAWMKLREAEADVGNYNIMDNHVTRNIIHRR